jgi:hypothetical protein
MVKKLLVLGDSFCHGVGTVSAFKDPRNIEFAFGSYVAKHLNLGYENLAEPGSSVLRTVENGYHYLHTHKNDIDTVMIGWTMPNRIGIYNNNAMLQILPSYILLGNNSDDDVFVEYQNNVKFITDKNNQRYLKVLPELHRLIIDNNFFHQAASSLMYVELFRTWLVSQKIKYYDFSVFGYNYNTCLSASFKDVMPLNRHPTITEQKKFADILIEQL